MIKEVYRLVNERLLLARRAPEGLCKRCAIEELEEVLQIIQELADYYDEEYE